MPGPNPSDTAGEQPDRDHGDRARTTSGRWERTNASYTTSAYALHYNGAAWRGTFVAAAGRTGPSSPILHGVTAIASNNVWAVGDNEEVPGLGLTTLIEHWNGSAWSIVSTRRRGCTPR